MDTLLLGLVPGIPQPALRAIRDRAAGIPLYAVETVRMLLDTGHLSESGGRFRLDGDLGMLAVPDSLQSLIGARLDTLDDRSRQLVGVASVLGLSWSVGALAAVARQPVADVRPGPLDGLVAREVRAVRGRSLRPRNGASTGSSRACCARSPTAGCRDATGSRSISRPRPISRRPGSDELAGIVASHYLSALAERPRRCRPGCPDRAGGRRPGRLPRPGRRRSAPTRSAAAYLADALGLATEDDVPVPAAGGARERTWRCRPVR